MLWAHPLGQVSAEELSWAQEGRLRPLDGKLVPLATADRELMLELQPSAAPRTEPVETRSPIPPTVPNVADSIPYLCCRTIHTTCPQLPPT